MNLSDMLGYADIGQLSRIADVYKCECNGNSKNELIQSILARVSRHDVFEEQIDVMKLEEMRFLNSLLFEARESYSLEDLIARVQQSRFGIEQIAAPEKTTSKTKRGKKNVMPAPPPSPRDVIARFKHQGWLFNGFSGPNRYLFQVPRDLKTRFKETLQRRFAKELVYTDDPPMYRDEQDLMTEDIKHLLHYVHHNEIQLTADGSMYKRFLLQLLDRMSVREELPGKGAWRFGYGRHFNVYPDRFSLLYDFCASNGYLSEKNECLSVTDKGLERLKGVPPEEREALYAYWLRLYKGPVANLLSLVHWIGALAGEWVSADSIKKVLLPFVKPYYYDDADAIMERRIMTVMMHLGLLRLGEHPVYGTVVRMTKAGEAIVSGKGLKLAH
ncbi:hypothetical protein PAT3040_06873 [Paenibacillus agaridevorans]|uniref:Helicase XPB/Ssl2 N-terminal domain-containing protein n=1 Tax=Paenibacillus agaridevorans TaxID=171404 RepID=A0A2R5F5E1_9BACL|nr:hypothetical protein [Paenibacillus agaridevorans]GBG12013.1 hypothetical protein PAT3040_06873 [Paenibacillus agaridevorans]